MKSGLNIWNIPLNVGTAPSITSFRNRCKAYLFSKAFAPQPACEPWPPSWQLSTVFQTMVCDYDFCHALQNVVRRLSAIIRLDFLD